MSRVRAATSMLGRYLVAAVLLVVNAPFVLAAYLFLALLGLFVGLVGWEALRVVGLPVGGPWRFGAAGYLGVLALFALGIRERVGARVDALVADAEPLAGSHPVRDRVGRLARVAETPTPAVLLLPDATPEAFSLRRDGEATVVVSEGLLEALDGRTLDAVLAHELAHIRNADFRAATALLYAVVAADTDHDAGEFEPDSLTDRVFRWHAAAGSVLPRVAAGTVSRAREFAADRGAVAVTGDPAALAVALERLDGKTAPERDARTAFANANVVPMYDPEGVFARFERTHPSTAERVERLRAMEARQERR